MGDTDVIKGFLRQQFKTSCIDLAVCTHPDSDHKGGFYGLLEDKGIIIRKFWLKAPELYISSDEFVRLRVPGKMQDACRLAYNHPTDPSKNLIEMATTKQNSDGTKSKKIVKEKRLKISQ